MKGQKRGPFDAAKAVVFPTKGQFRVRILPAPGPKGRAVLPMVYYLRINPLADCLTRRQQVIPACQLLTSSAQGPEARERPSSREEFAATHGVRVCADQADQE